MNKIKDQNMLVRIVVYLIGLFIIAFGINISKMSGLGISPVSSVPGVLDGIFKSVMGAEAYAANSLVSLGNMVIVVYVLLVIAQLIVLRKKFQVKNILGVPIAIVFGWMIDLIGLDKAKLWGYGGLLERAGATKIMEYAKNNLIIAVVILLVSIVVIGIGVYIYLSPNLVPMPAEGLAQGISQIGGFQFGNCKTTVDFSLIFLALVLQVLCLGGFATLLPGKGVVGIGTILSALCVGQVVKFISKIFRKSK